MVNRETSARLYSLITVAAIGVVAVVCIMTMPVLRDAEMFILPALVLIGWLSMPSLIRFFGGRTSRFPHRQ